MVTVNMSALLRQVNLLWKDRGGQDMVEYALMAASMAVATVAFLPTATFPIISNTFSAIVSVMQASINAS